MEKSTRETLRKRTEEVLAGVTARSLAERVRERVVGQDEAVDGICLFLVTALRRMALVAGGAGPDGLPHLSALMIEGPSGCGKTLAVEAACEALGAIPVHRVDGSQLTGAGWKGDGVEAHLRDLAAMQAESMGPILVFVDEADKLVKDNGRRDGFDPCAGLLRAVEGDDVVRVRAANRSNGDETVPLDKAGLVFVFAGAFTGLDRITRERLVGERGGAAAGFAAGAGTMAASSMPADELRRLSTPDDLVAWGLPVELVGRITSLVRIRPLEVEDVVTVARGQEGSVEARYAAMMPHGCSFSISDGAARRVAEEAVRSGRGARGVEAAVSAAACEAVEVAERDSSIVSCSLVLRDGAVAADYVHGERPAAPAPRDEGGADGAETPQGAAPETVPAADAVGGAPGQSGCGFDPAAPPRWRSDASCSGASELAKMAVDLYARSVLLGSASAPDPLMTIDGHQGARSMAMAFAAVLMPDLDAADGRIAYDLLYGSLSFLLDWGQALERRPCLADLATLLGDAVAGRLPEYTRMLQSGELAASLPDEGDDPSRARRAALRALLERGLNGNEDAALRHWAYFLALSGENGSHIAAQAYAAATALLPGD